MTDEAVVTSADIEALIEAELLVFNSAKLVEAQFELTGEPIITTPGLPEAGPLASKLAGLRAALGFLEGQTTIGKLEGDAFALADLQFAVDTIWLAYGLGRVKGAILWDVHASRVGQSPQGMAIGQILAAAGALGVRHPREVAGLMRFEPAPSQCVTPNFQQRAVNVG